MIAKKLFQVDEVIHFIQQGKKMVLSGDEQLLALLPKGNWIGGTTPYFIGEEGGICTHDRIFVDDFTDIAIDFKTCTFTPDTIHQITSMGYDNGIILLILPYAKPILLDFAVNSLSYPDIFKNPLLGFVAGVDIENLGHIDAKTFNGVNGEKSTENGVALFVKIPDHQIARVEIINIFNQDPGGDEITFIKDGFTQSDCLINGRNGNIYEYLIDQKFDRRLPIIANYAGAFINRDIQTMDGDTRSVRFFAPVFKGDKYKVAIPIDNYQKTFVERIPTQTDDVIYSCNCVSNYINGKLDGKKLHLKGAMVYGEIAYQLLNMTQIYLAIDEF